jgi:hypothetical protein
LVHLFFQNIEYHLYFLGFADPTLGWVYREELAVVAVVLDVGKVHRVVCVADRAACLVNVEARVEEVAAWPVDVVAMRMAAAASLLVDEAAA